MLVYLIRHGIAVERGTPGVPDGERPLTPQGLRRLRQSVRGLHRLQIDLDTIWTSPLTRARQTAEVLAAGFALTHAIRQEPALLPDADPARIIELLRKQPKQGKTALVGHEPHLGRLATFLLTGLKTGAIEFKKGGAACIEIDRFHRPLRGRLRWLLTPRQMRRIKKTSKTS